MKRDLLRFSMYREFDYAYSCYGYRDLRTKNRSLVPTTEQTRYHVW